MDPDAISLTRKVIIRLLPTFYKNSPATIDHDSPLCPVISFWRHANA